MFAVITKDSQCFTRAQGFIWSPPILLERRRVILLAIWLRDGLYPLVTLRFIPLVDVKRFLELLELQLL